MTVHRNGARSTGHARTAVAGLVLALAAAGCSTPGPDTSSASPTPQAADGGAKAALGNVPLSFVENRGQVDGPVSYYVQGGDTSLYFGPGGVTYSLTKSTQPKASAHSPALASAAATDMQRWAVKLDFVGANPVAPTGVDLAQGVVSYFGASAEKSHTAIPTYSSIAYRDLWPGIDMVYSGTGSQLKYDFVVHPGADPSRIRLAYRGAEKVAINDKGQINVSTPAGGFTDDKPFTYQDIGGKRIEVASSYTVEPGTNAGDATVRIPVGDYDTTKELVIDPAVFVYSGFIGGAGEDDGLGIAADEVGNAYVTGYTRSPDFPLVAGPGAFTNGTPTAFVTKVNPAGTGVVYSGFIEGASFGSDIEVDDAGAAYITGIGRPTFQGTVHYNGAPGGAFVAKVNPAGTALDYAGTIGVRSQGVDIAVDGAGQAYFIGLTESPQTFPAVVGPDTTPPAASFGAFVAKASADGSVLLYAGFLPHASMDIYVPGGIAVDAQGSAYITAGGRGAPGEPLVPGTPGPGLATGNSDAVVYKVTPDGTGFIYAGYLGGDDVDAGHDIDVDTAGNAYITGYTHSSPASLPAAASREVERNTRRSRYTMNPDAFVFKVNAAGTDVVYAAYVGGQFQDIAFGLAVDQTGAAFITGRTTSDRHTDFNDAGGPDPTFNGNLDAFVAKLNPAGSSIDYAGYIGGAGADQGYDIALDQAGSPYIAGHAVSGGGFATTVGPDVTYGGAGDAFVVKVAETGG